jgi:hypothetical protein
VAWIKLRVTDDGDGGSSPAAMIVRIVRYELAIDGTREFRLATAFDELGPAV